MHLRLVIHSPNLQSPIRGITSTKHTESRGYCDQLAELDAFRTDGAGQRPGRHGGCGSATGRPRSVRLFLRQPMAYPARDSGIGLALVAITKVAACQLPCVRISKQLAYLK